MSRAGRGRVVASQTGAPPRSAATTGCGCTFNTCDAPPLWCETNHRPEWRDSHRTSVDAAALMCAHDHDHFTALGWTGAIINGRPHWIPPDTSTPTKYPEEPPSTTERSFMANVSGVYDAIVLAGGAARRLGGVDKPGIQIDGVSLLDRVIDAAKGAERVIVVGPVRATRGEVRWVREDPPGGGPVAAIAAGIQHVDQPWCLVLAADLPWVAPAVPLLLTAATGMDVAVLESSGRRNHLAAVWSTEYLRGALAALDEVDGAAARDLYVGAELVEVDDDRGWGQDCDTWEDVQHVRAKGDS